MSKKKRRRFTVEQKVAIIERLVFKNEKVSDLADEYGIQPSVIYNWQRQLQSNLATALESNHRPGQESSRERELQAKLEALEARLTTKDEVIAELSEELVKLKKNTGNR